MEVLVTDFSLRLCQVRLSSGASVGDLSHVLSRERGVPNTDFYVKSNGRVLAEDEELQAGGWYRLEPRLCGGKGGFGSMLRALGAQIEKTTNREACRDLSGRRLRDVNHEKEMAEWLKKQADREAEKEQRRMERLQRKLAEPKHYFNDPEYERQCQDLSERVEESIKKGLQASSSGTSGASRKRASAYGADPGKRPRLWQSGVDDVSSSEDDSEGSDEEASPSSSSSSSSSSSNQQSSSAPPPHSRTLAPSTSTSTPPPHKPTQLSCTSTSSSASSSPQRSPEETTEQEALREAEPVAEREAEPVAEREEEPVSQQEAEPVAQTEAQTLHNTPNPEEQAESTAAPPIGDGPLDLQAIGGAAELEVLGLDRLKAELMSLGVKCGGTLQERAARLFSIRGLSQDQIPPGLLAKPAKAAKPRRK